MARVGVFICWCGNNIADNVNVDAVRDAAALEPGVVCSENYRYMCSSPGQNLIHEKIKEFELDRIVIASCTPRLHEKTFRGCIEQANLNPYLLEIANIREQCSWVHSDRELATKKAIELVKMSIAKVKRNRALKQITAPMEKRALIIGGGIGGIQAALDIAMAGHSVVVVERNPSIGGRMAQLDKTFPTMDCSACILTPRMVSVSQNPAITIHTYSEIESVSGHVGDFTAKIRKRARSVDIKKCVGCGLCAEKCPIKTAKSEFDADLLNRPAIYIPFPQAVPNVPVIDRNKCTFFLKGKCKLCQKVCPADAIDYTQEDEIIEECFGGIVIATGHSLLDPSIYTEYGGGKIKNVITGLQLERSLSSCGPWGGQVLRPSDHKEPKTIVFIQCVGSRDEQKGKPYCSKLCCMYTAKQSILIKEHVPDARIFVFYIDIRASGKNYEEFVRRAQVDYGVTYIRGRVSKLFEEGEKVVVRGADTLSGEPVTIKADMVVLATAIIARPDTKQMAQKLGVAINKNDFYSEAHPKLGPVESLSAGIFLAGSCESPKDIPETVASASGAAVKALVLFSKDEMVLEPTIAFIDTRTCVLCGTCREICPFGAIEEEEVTMRNGSKIRQMRVLESVCHGCGVCVSSCRSQCIRLQGSEGIFDVLESFKKVSI